MIETTILHCDACGAPLDILQGNLNKTLHCAYCQSVTVWHGEIGRIIQPAPVVQVQPVRIIERQVVAEPVAPAKPIKKKSKKSNAFALVLVVLGVLYLGTTDPSSLLVLLFIIGIAACITIPVVRLIRAWR